MVWRMSTKRLTHDEARAANIAKPPDLLLNRKPAVAALPWRPATRGCSGEP